MKKLFILLIVIVFVSCASAPSNFIRTSDVGWSVVPIRNNIDFNDAWNKVIDVLTSHFEMEMISKEGAYARTGWIYTWNTNGIYMNNYRTRVIIKFSPDRRNVDIKTEAQYNKYGVWENGFDTNLLKTIKEDIMGAIGRTTR